jgi:hypothetical protein
MSKLTEFTVVTAVTVQRRVRMTASNSVMSFRVRIISRAHTKT